jgi:hypothetical protein
MLTTLGGMQRLPAGFQGAPTYLTQNQSAHGPYRTNQKKAGSISATGPFASSPDGNPYSAAVSVNLAFSFHKVR